MKDISGVFFKQYNQIIKEARADSKLEYCLCCNKKVSSFCNSHSLPKFILSNLSEMGMILNSNHFFEAPFIKEAKGVNNSGTFHRICNECDNNLFKDYENENKLLELPRKKIMAQIDLKNTLKMYDKRLNEISIYRKMLSGTDGFWKMELLEKQKVNYLDLNEIKKEFQRALDILNKKSTSSYELIYWNVLDYVAPIGFQGHIALPGDLKGGIINDIYNHSPKYVIENINLCVFPLKEKTVVIMFINKEHKKYKLFIQQFKKLKEEEKLNLISYIIFNYSEEFFISPNSKKDILENDDIKVITRNVSDMIALNEEMANEMKKLKFLELMEYKNFTNLLAKENSLIYGK